MYVCTYTSRIQIDSKAAASHNLILTNFQQKNLHVLKEMYLYMQNKTKFCLWNMIFIKSKSKLAYLVIISIPLCY